MIRSASGTYSLPSACMKSYWVSTSQKMTRAMAGNLSEDTGACQQQGGRTKSLPVLEFEDYGDLITTVVARAPHTVRPHLEREVLALGGHEARLQKEGRLAGQREDFGQSVRARLGDQGREQRAADARPLPIRPDGEGGELRELSRVNLERSATDDLARRGLRDDIFLDVAAEVVVAARQQVAGLNGRSHEGFELRHVRQHRFPRRPGGELGEVRAQPLGLATNVGEKRGIGDRPHDLEGDARNERPAAERGGVVTRLERRGDGARHEDRPHG